MIKEIGTSPRKPKAARRQAQGKLRMGHSKLPVLQFFTQVDCLFTTISVGRCLNDRSPSKE